MGIFGKSAKDQEIERLTLLVHTLQSQIAPEQREIEQLRTQIASLVETRRGIEKDLATLSSQKVNLSQRLATLQNDVIQTEEVVLLQSFGLYEPRYDLQNSYEYKTRLAAIRTSQKEMVRNGHAASGNTSWVLNNNAALGKKLVQDMQKLLLRAFNAECDDAVEHVKFNNYDASLKRITASYDAISKLGKMMNIAITHPYYQLKVDELTLALEYQMQKQKEKEEQKAERERMREEAKIQKEIEESRKRIEKEKTHYSSALKALNNQLMAAKESEKAELISKRDEIAMHLEELETNLKDIDYREANQRAGYVYVISNIGSFGENVYKIGMTRRLDPMERINELGDASVPFNFDVHAMIFSDDAPALEAALHHAFEGRKLNMVNQRREFFSVTLDEIKAVVKSNFDKTAEFIDTADAEQYRISQKMRKQIK